MGHRVTEIVREDPFYVHGLADFRVVEFRASQRAGDIRQRLDRYDPDQRRANR